MSKKNLIFILLLLNSILLFSATLNLSPIQKNIHLSAPIPDSISINDKHIIPQSIEIQAFIAHPGTDKASLVSTLKPNIDYIFDTHIFFFTHSSYDSLTITYSVLPERLFQRYNLFEPFEMTDTTKVKTLKSNWESALLEKSRLNITGSKTFAVSVSNSNMVGVNQSLFLKIDGELADNVSIQAQINDNASPITPEGDSKELSSLDEMYIRVYGKQYDIAFGNLKFEIIDTQFINYKPIFEGLKASYFDRQKVTGAVAVSNSRNANISFNGNEAKQGPYFLKPDGIFHNVKILSGSETIYLNGQQMHRGEDYRIDYNEGSIEFYLKHFITSTSRIHASFQYSDEDYRKNSFLGSTEINLTDRLKVAAAAIYQDDDKDNPLSETLSNTDKEILKNAGDTITLISGEIFIGQGLGAYKKDTQNGIEIYVYAPGDPEAHYELRFVQVDTNNGDYRQVSLYQWQYVGENQGDWKVGREIKAPQKRANYDFSLKYSHDIFDLYYEALFSELDKNTFSPIDNDDNISQIHHIEANFHPDWDRFTPKLKTYYRYRQKELFTFAPIQKPEDAYQLGSITHIDSLNSNEYYINLKTVTLTLLTQETTYKLINYDNELSLHHLILNQSIEQRKYLPKTNYKLTFTKQSGKTSEQRPQTSEQRPQTSEITIHEPAIEYNIKKMTLKGNARLYNETHSAPTVEAGGGRGEVISRNKQNTYFTQLAINELLNSGIALSYQREETQSHSTFLITPSQLQTDTYTLNLYTQRKNHQITALYSHRIVKDLLDETADQKFDIAEIRSTNRLFNDGLRLNTIYNLKNTEFYLRGRELVYVGSIAGLYDSTGVWADTGEYDWETVIIGDPKRSIELQANLNAYTYPALFVHKNSKIYNFLDKINLESYLSISEQTENPDKWKVYLLHPNAIANQHSIYSRQEHRQVLWYNIQRNKWIARYTYRTDSSQDRRYIITTIDPMSENKITEHEYTLRRQKVLNSDIEAIYAQKTEIQSRYDINAEINKYAINIKTAFKNQLTLNTQIALEQENTTSHSQTQSTDRYIVSEEILYFIKNHLRINANISLKYNDTQNPINTYLPHEKQQGYIIDWKAGLNYRINTISTININCTGNKYPKRDTDYQVSMEVKLEF